MDVNAQLNKKWIESSGCVICCQETKSIIGGKPKNVDVDNLYGTSYSFKSIILDILR